MTAPALLILCAILAAVLGPRLRSGNWADRSPRLGVLVWQALTLSAVLSVVLAGLALAVPVLPATEDLAALLQACTMVLRAQYATPAGALLSGAGAATALALLARVAGCLVAEWLAARRQRNQQLQTLSLIARRDPACGVRVVEHPVPAAYCLPGRRRDIVFTSTALGVLNEDERNAVLRHELAHLRGRHHLVLGAAGALERAFPRVALFGVARSEMGRLVELAADDRAAADGSGRLAVARALLRLTEAGRAPASALSASGTATVARVRRLTAPPVPLRRAGAGFAASAAVAVLAAPVAVSVAPAIAAAQARFCPLGMMATV